MGREIVTIAFAVERKNPMKIKLLTFLLASFVLVTTAEAKVYYKNKPIVDTHVLTIKGFLYELSHGVVSPQAVHRRSSYAKALSLIHI